MTTSSLTKNIDKLRTKISKGNLKSIEESKLHMKLDGLRRIRSGLRRLESELESLNNN